MNTLDLHGKSYEDAKILTEIFVENNVDCLPIQIITGNSNEMKRIVLKIVKIHKLNAYPKTDYNLGCLIINNFNNL
tara:strand:+ start:93 stop:320 length:228 start_codon:yes stop_codon:yes gene_type:complete